MKLIEENKREIEETEESKGVMLQQIVANSLTTTYYFF